MTRPALDRIAACLATGLLAATASVGGVLVSPGTASAAEPETPLEVSIESLNPSTIPARGPITVTGQVTNRSDEEWSDLNVYLLTSASPFRTRAELAEANATDPALEIGSRLTDERLFDTVGDLPAGASTSYTLSVPRGQLEISGETGVYWLGVHVLGANATGRDGVADARARTFMPLMQPGGPATTMSLAVPIRNAVLRAPDGTLAHLAPWHRRLSPEGRLGRLLEFSDTASGVPLTWVVDPAVLDAAATAASDNAAMSSAPTDDDSAGEGSPSPSPSSSPSDAPSDDEPAEPSEGARQAAAWLRSFARQATEHSVLTVPYGDLDVASAVRNDFDDLYEQATDLSAQTMEALEVEAAPVIDPETGLLPDVVVNRLDRETPILLSDAAVPDAGQPVVQTAEGRRVVLTDTAGGPAPTDPFAALAVRQRIVSEAALHALSDDRNSPLVVTTPHDWDPGPDWRIADFFSGLDVPWLGTRDVPGVLALSELDEGGPPVSDDGFRYPREQRRAEIPIPNLLASRSLGEVGTVFAELLTRNGTVDEFLAKSAMTTSSTNVRPRPRPAATRARETTDEIRSRMERVRIEGPSFVTMSSEEGTLTVTINNELDEPVTVGIGADASSDGLVIEQPEPVELGAGQRATVRLRAASNSIGVYSVTLLPTTADGEPLGTATTFSVRSSQVGLVIWVIMGIGAAVLVIASAARITRRIRHHRSSPKLEGVGR